MKRKINKTRKIRGGKIYGADRYKMYNIHKVTNISYDPIKSCKAIQDLLGKSNVSEIQSPPDKTLKKRGIRWVRCLKGMKAEFHFVKPYKIAYDKTLRKIVKMEDKFDNPYRTQFLENHVGLYVPDLTPVVENAQKKKYKYIVFRRGDGLNHFYVNLPGTLNYLELDSQKLDIDKLPDVEVHDFQFAAKVGKKLEKKFRKKTKRRRNRRRYKKSRKAGYEVYMDPEHKMTRKVNYLKDRKIKITGKDSLKGKKWTIKGELDKNNKATLDFSSKGGPKDIKATFRKNDIKFADGNTWKRV